MSVTSQSGIERTNAASITLSSPERTSRAMARSAARTIALAMRPTLCSACRRALSVFSEPYAIAISGSDAPVTEERHDQSCFGYGCAACCQRDRRAEGRAGTGCTSAEQCAQRELAAEPGELKRSMHRLKKSATGALHGNQALLKSRAEEDGAFAETHHRRGDVTHGVSFEISTTEPAPYTTSPTAVNVLTMPPASASGPHRC